MTTAEQTAGRTREQTAGRTREQIAGRTREQNAAAPVLVLGATGKTGRRVVARLRDAGRIVRAASRSAETHFDWMDRATWASALDGMRALGLVAPPDPEPIADFVAEAEAAGVRRFVVLSGRGVHRYGMAFEPSLAEAERAVREADVDWTLIRPNSFAQNFAEDLYAVPLRAGLLTLPVGAVAEPFIDVEDVADVMAALLTEEGHTYRTYELSGPRALTFAEVTAEISAVSGRPMRFEAVTAERYVADLTAGGMPEEAARSLAHGHVFLSEGHNTEPTTDVRYILGREPRDFSEYVKSVAAGIWS
ncbi:NAD(P)H-binding protein [Streptomyces sp. NPDC017940]|uniref:NAD(P)H-binding protein n=1 Tax=Streptomyces sp. NPDC017940 TaxID=3365017 RepID=UPI0037AD53B7